ncbi:cytidylate kinase [Azospirillum fermentarium]|uniref:cytidylate kinase-like family protein n=1 Tax=Azospirillum fermentarium TaxID=1233114 RepID=UPI002226DC0F|nr:cytidylate kinase-like family protein [Azospirillum fermentarium]MCW2244785.1 cytidylate kinase [Azospirillum fermentarium]
MAHNELQAIMSILTTEDRHHGTAAGPPPVVTVSRDHGAGGEAIAAALAERLGVRCYDRDILDRVVASATSDPALMRVLDERAPEHSGMFLYTTLLGRDDPVPEYQRLLTRVIHGIAAHGGVILGRGAHLLLRGEAAFRVCIVGSEGACARRLAGGNEAAATALRDEVRAVNARRTAYLRDLFKVERDDPRHYDLTLNTDRAGDPATVAAVIDAARTAMPHKA